MANVRKTGSSEIVLERNKDILDQIEVSLIVKNYRCFTNKNSLKLELRSGHTAFIGANNSGKSTILKFFWEFRSLFKLFTNSHDLQEILHNKKPNLEFPKELKDSARIFNNRTTDSIEIILNFKYPHEMRSISTYPIALECNVSRDSRNISKIRIYLMNENGEKTSVVLKNGDALLNIAPGELVNPIIQNKEKQIICNLEPLVRTMKLLARTCYLGAYRSTYGEVDASEKYFDLSLGTAFVKRWSRMKTGNNQFENDIALKVENDIGSIFKIRNIQINASDGNDTLIIVFDGKSYKLDELGSGLAQFILTFATCAIEKPSFILLDEPELNLHPAVQLDFLTSLSSYSTNGIMYATHSYGLARSSADRVFGLHRTSISNPPYIRPLEDFEHLTEMLGELSYASYRELGYNAILLVEGPTEIKAIQQLLRWYEIDHKFVLIPLCGNNLINTEREQELSDILRISENIFALVDSEKQSEDDTTSEKAKERIEFRDMCEKIGIDCHITKRRAFENYIPQRSIDKAFRGQKFQALSRFDKLSEITPHWNKKHNWKAVREMDKSDIDGTDLGEFLDKLRKSMKDKESVD